MINRYAYGRRGWFGNSQGHALAARGMRLYAARKPAPKLVDPMFYTRREEKLPFTQILYMVDKGMTYDEMRREHPDVDAEDLRERGLKAMEMRSADRFPSIINENKSVDSLLQQAHNNPYFAQKVRETLADPQKSSFLMANGSAAKVQILRQRMNEVPS